MTRISWSRYILKWNIGKPARLKDKVTTDPCADTEFQGNYIHGVGTFAQEETIPDIWMFGDLD